MFLPKSALLFGLILTLLLDPILGRKGGGGHNYPRSGGLSGGGHRSGGLSGGHGYPSQSHAYPSQSHAGSQSHAYPSGGSQSHAYPSGGSQSHAYPSGGSQSHAYPGGGGGGSQSHGYPSPGKGHGYPASPGLSGSGSGHGYPSKPAGSHTTNVYNNYHYTPPAQISYAAPRGGPPVNYPVYHGTPPNYVYQYKDSGSKYGTLLAGLALMNLGTLGVAAYAAHKASGNGNGGGGSAPVYKAQPGEVCKFAIKKENGDYEETRIDCQIISGFILQDMQAHSTGNSGNNSTVTTTTTVTNVTTVNITNGVPDPTTTTPAPQPQNVLYSMLPNGTLVPINITGVVIPGLSDATTTAAPNVTTTAAPGASSVQTVTTTTTNTTVVNALDVKGKPVDVTPGMQCFVIRHSPTSNMRKTVPCGLLQTYADKSIQTRSSAARTVPMFTVVAAILAYCVA